MEYRLRPRRSEVTARARFILANTEIISPPLVPEIKLRLAAESVPLWQKTEEELGRRGLEPPFWAFAWAGGQVLARHVLDDPEIVHRRSVIDLGTGSGLVAIAAAKAGARLVLAAAIDEFACEAASLNAAINGVAVTTAVEDLLAVPAPAADIILVGDLFYEQSLAGRTFAWLAEARARGIDSLIGDPGRAYLPKHRLAKLAQYDVPVTRDLEGAEIKQSAVWQLRD